MILSPFIVRPLLELLDTPASIIDWCDSYLMILMIGIGGLAFYNILSGILRGMGDSVSALLYLLIATVMNIVLDIFFVKDLQMGVSGVALATVIAQTFSGILCLIRLMKMRDIFDLKLRYLRPKKKYCFSLIRLGIPSGLTQMILSMAMIVVQSLTNSFGEQFIAANVIVMRVDGFAMMPNFSFGTTMTTYAGQNVGARKYDRVYQGARQGTLIAMATSATITGLILIFGRQLMGIFTADAAVIALGAQVLRIEALAEPMFGASIVASGAMQGAGDSTGCFVLNLVSMWGIRLTLATLLAPHFGLVGVWIAMSFELTMRGVLFLVRLARGKWLDKGALA